MPALSQANAIPFEVGETFTRSIVFDAESIQAFATMAGDMNPLHHDIQAAQASRFKGLIASGTHTLGLMLGALATYISGRSSAVGLEFSVRLKKAIRAGETTKVIWTVTDIAPKPSLGGDIVTFSGELFNECGTIALSVTTTNLIFHSEIADEGE